MGLFNDAINAVYNTEETIQRGAKGIVDDVSTWCQGLFSQTAAAISSSFDGDVVGLNANKIPEMIDAIEAYIKRVETHLNNIKTSTSTENAMKGEYAIAVKTYVQTACDTCYEITSQLRYFEDKLIAVEKAYKSKDENLQSAINATSDEMNSRWSEYKPGGVGSV